MKLCRASRFLSAASTNVRMAEEETPCASGLLRGRSAPMPRELLKATKALAERVFILRTSECDRAVFAATGPSTKSLRQALLKLVLHRLDGLAVRVGNLPDGRDDVGVLLRHVVLLRRVMAEVEQERRGVLGAV